MIFNEVRRKYPKIVWQKLNKRVIAFAEELGENVSIDCNQNDYEIEVGHEMLKTLIADEAFYFWLNALTAIIRKYSLYEMPYEIFDSGFSYQKRVLFFVVANNYYQEHILKY